MTDKSIKEYAQQALLLMDLTSLTDSESEQDIINLCQQAKSEAGNTAAICIYPRFIPIAKKALNELNASDVKIATVTNFPHGNSDIDIAIAETNAAIAYGADEVDLVFPYKALINGDKETGFNMVSACKKACQQANVLLKVIIESGELKTDELIKSASEICINAGADFIKTSTGKVPVNATPESAKVMLSAIKALNTNVGFKAAGGVRSAEDAKVYLDMAQDLLGADWVTADKFRFGASSLLSNLLETLGKANGSAPSSNY